MFDCLPGHTGFRTRCNEDFLKVELPGQVRGARKLQHPRGLAVLLKGPEQSVFTSISSDQAVPLSEPGRERSLEEGTETPGASLGMEKLGLVRDLACQHRKVGEAPNSPTCLSKRFPLG